MYFPLFLSLFWYALLCAIHLEEEERAGCFAFIVLRMSCCCKCTVALPHCVVCWSAVCDCVLTYFIKTFCHLASRLEVIKRHAIISQNH